MKRTILILLFCFSVAKIQAQDCKDGYFPNKQGMKFDYTFYDKKDKVSSVSKYQVNKLIPVANGIEVFFSNETFDSKGKTLVKADYSAKCQNGQFEADIRNIISSIPTQVSPNMELNVSGDKISYPNVMVAGQKLKDVETEIKSSMKNGISIMTMKIKITERTVEAIENITVPAGNFICAKITYMIDIKFGLVKQKQKTTEYIAKEIGIVKQESFDEKGRKISSQVLSKLER